MRKQAKSFSRSRPRAMRIGLREQDVRKRRTQRLLVISGTAIVVQFIAMMVYLNFHRASAVAVEQVLTSQGNVHINADELSPIAYNSTPPTSGPHYDNRLAWNTYTTPQRYEHLLNNLEDGGVIVYYQCADGCPDIVNGLTALVAPYLKTGRKLILAPNQPTWMEDKRQPLHRDMRAKIAVTAWQHLLTMDAVDSQQIRAFIKKYEGIDHHTGGG